MVYERISWVDWWMRRWQSAAGSISQTAEEWMETMTAIKATVYSQWTRLCVRGVRFNVKSILRSEVLQRDLSIRCGLVVWQQRVLAYWLLQCNRNVFRVKIPELWGRRHVASTIQPLCFGPWCVDVLISGWSPKPTNLVVFLLNFIIVFQFA